jgi:hypothetical protein
MREEGRKRMGRVAKGVTRSREEEDEEEQQKRIPKKERDSRKKTSEGTTKEGEGISK